MSDELNMEQELQVQTQEPSAVEAASGQAGEWYIIQCYSNQEHKVLMKIQNLIEEKQLQGKVLQVLVPEEDTIEIKNNKRLEKRTKIFPGYVFIEMLMSDDVFYDIRSISGVSKFIGSKSRPTPVTEDEILKVLRKIGDKTRKVDVDFEEGEVIKVVAGPFRGYSGPIAEINADKGNLKALISIFGRETPVKLDFDQVEKAVE
jgi:transcriptional antiterminator NusG